jgi:prephenate dehydrogenase
MNGGRHIVLIGGGGRMGSMFSALMRSAGMPVRAFDRPLEAKAAEHCPGASLLLLCVPVAALPDVLQKTAPHLDGTQVLADIASVKIRPLALMQAAYRGPVVGTHPLFGPNIEKTGGERRVALCPGSAAREDDVLLVENVLAGIGCACFRTTAEEHDEAAAHIQGLNFVTNAAYFAALAEHPEFLPFLTPSFARRREAARSMLTEDGPLFEAIFEANPACQNAVRRYRSFLNLAAGGDLSLLRERALWWWKDENTT